MFLKALRRQNSKLIDATLTLHKQGKLLPDSYIVDLEQFKCNAKLIKDKADEFGIRLYGMTKQFGRNATLAKVLQEIGYEGIVAVDYKEARILHRQGIKISHIGHLVQPPESVLREVIQEIQPEVITVYSLAKAQSISDIAFALGVKQKVLVKFINDRDILYVNQESGFPLSEIDNVLNELTEMPGIELEGLTHFPCFLHDGESTKPTLNVNSLVRAKEHWISSSRPLNQVNMPSATCCTTLPMIHEFGGTHGEPGHALTGTFPENRDGSQPERIAMLYLSEISHHHKCDSYCFAGGYYRRGNLDNALIDSEFVKVSNDDTNSIDYHLKVEGIHKVGTPLIMAFRTQVFVTRSDVVIVDGIQSGQPKVLGRYTALGDPINE
ncbi:YhfX family PLP-dependent enzyme [Vibrio aestuarianus]|uniref:YhfX family PLP-dependent enzyme n=1 Tax=Vibrio aestuarianus TaxID=28171 RepID=UPI00237D1BD3|nr:YhfX family PLP-dependent enzyme [Vibrio aestuarianus]MDE1239744.1 YhfX family PLP-dependent enzyme [Vibrio aestuarianus]MDE1250862.1 YhfX family PLP-dependent enzyme [Vibrio aestuarianus]